MTVVLVGLGLLLLALLGAPLFAVIAAVALLGFHGQELDLSIVMIEFYRLADMPVLVAIPLFTVAGFLLAESQAPRRLVRLSDALLGWMPGGLAIVAILTCALFTAFTGASGVTIVAIGAILLPAMLQAGYPRLFALGLLTTCGSLGLLLAPALPLILYAVVAQHAGGAAVGVDDMFRAGLLPALLMILMLGAYAVWQGRRLPPRPPREAKGWQEVRAALLDVAWELPLPVIVLGGIYAGWFAASEAAAVTAAYTLILTVVIRREVNLRALPGVLRESMVLVGAILLIFGVSLAFTNYLVDAEVPARVFAFIREHVDSKLAFLMLLNLFLLLMGMCLDIFSATVILVPLLLPIAEGYGIDATHLGVIFLANMELGYFTPPIGMTLFIAAYRFNVPIWTLVRACVPFFLILFAAVLIITYVPSLSLALVR
ncbi:TRAP transporter large permease [Pseudofulvimonas gallinarii]|uniref:TRAP transporter large permease protein n=1 Tax=Pseudofulvimonas gallinarii TaxID=634155 RepID=A0A4R3LLF8_9GAMM|nr:TRAP transporter large permease subunit [Pseudofulvimonas gallinarii]TCT01180.1 tripartite ATP-independent transporter DctM subunit [Pseudofulvimonas gallinarii]THD14949.1 C4-dicarboxylate ABC transporter [Pseudofulvimonas gallinarii]